MGFFGWLFGKVKQLGECSDARLQRLIYQHYPYDGTVVLPGTRLPKHVTLSQEFETFGISAGDHPLNSVLFKFWLGVDPKLCGYCLKQIQDGGFYRSYFVEHPKSGKTRKIDEPVAVLKFIQRRILERVLNQVNIHPAAHGFIAGRSVFTNAEPHVGKQMVINMDLRDFFPTITFKRVVGLLKSIGFSKKNAFLLAGLCCYKGVLPQGAPTSPMISNLICRKLDLRLSGVMAKAGGSYTRYADDLTFSGNETIKHLLPLIRRIIREEGFRCAPEKFRIQRRGNRQMVTGLVVNDRVSVPRKQRRRVRAMVHNESKNSETQHDYDRLGYAKGYASFMKPSHPEEAKRLLQAISRWV